MCAVSFASVVFACVFGSALVGLLVRGALPDHHFSQDSRDVVKLGTGLIATLAALVLGLLISSAKSSFDRMGDELVENASRVVSLDRTLADYGPEASEIRALVKRIYAERIELLFPSKETREGKLDTPREVVGAERIQAELLSLTPANDAQRWLRAQAVETSSEISSTRWLLLMQKDVAIPMTLLVVLVCWLSLIFTTFGVLAPRNATVLAVLFVCALSAAGAILLILEMNSPFEGFMRLSSAPMRHALADLGR
jgi:hypothetical protein